MGKNIAIDGPAGAGKSTIAKRVAKELSFLYVDTGALYRALGLFFLDRGIAAEDAVGMEETVQDAKVEIAYQDGTQHVYVNEVDVTDRLRDEKVSQMASICSALPAVRAHLLMIQRETAKANDVVMDGRDIGTTILPDADCKIFLTANVEERARRRYEQLIAAGEQPVLAEIEEEIRIRDHRDETRKESPLRKAEDAVLIDSSTLTIDEVVDAILTAYQTAVSGK